MKKGFTLAEVLITMALIGVVAAMVLPALSTNTQKASVGPSLAKMMNTLENANRLILVENSARSLQTVCKNAEGEDDYFACLKTYVPGNIVDLTDTSYYGYDMTTAEFTPTRAYLTNDGMTLFVGENPAAEAIENVPAPYFGRYYKVYVDTNGIKKKTNSVGHDTFLFYVDLNGSVIPYGGNSYKAYTSGESVLWETECLKSGPTVGASCTGSIADNGWKVVY